MPSRIRYTDEVIEALLALLNAFEKQDITGLKIELNVKTPHYSKPPKRHVGTFFGGSVSVYEEEV